MQAYKSVMVHFTNPSNQSIHFLPLIHGGVSEAADLLGVFHTFFSSETLSSS